MLGRVKNVSEKVRHLHVLRKSADLTAADVLNARNYIDGYWPKLQRYNPDDEDSLIGLPNPYLVPACEEAQEFDFNEMYYWDSYFMVQGMLDVEHRELVLGILENLITLYKRYKIIPNASRTYLMGRSQPPLLTTFIWEVYEAYDMGTDWLGEKLTVAESEYHTVWMGTAKPNWRQVHQGLSRYYDINMLHDLAEAESGWDMTPRYGRKALNVLPVDLNALLYKYETDFARYYELIENKTSAKKWNQAAKQRAAAMNALMWSNARGLYYDYNYDKKRKGSVSSLAAYFPLWAGMADKKHAAQLVKSLRRFEEKGGLSTTEAQSINTVMPGSLPTQWAHPNGWAPLHFIVIQGLQRYGYHADAHRIATKWLRTNLDWYNKNGVFLEKYNVVAPNKPPVKGLYPSQTGFGWTNAVFERLCQEFIDGRSN